METFTFKEILFNMSLGIEYISCRIYFENTEDRLNHISILNEEKYESLLFVPGDDKLLRIVNIGTVFAALGEISSSTSIKTKDFEYIPEKDTFIEKEYRRDNHCGK